jgi:aryl-alcohol dehydrogenase-like predicted oxidoreductase
MRNLTRDSIMAECEASLRRLQTDVIDIYQCHWPDPDTPASDTMSALLELLEQGKIRAIGVSNFSCQEMEAARTEGVLHLLQAPYSMLHRRADEEQLPYCRKHNIGYFAYGPLAKGLLTGKFDENSQFTDIRARDRQFQDELFRKNLDIVNKLKQLAGEYNKTLAQLAVNWVMHTPGMTSALVGAKRPSQVKENAGAAGWNISDADRERIETILRGE